MLKKIHSKWLKRLLILLIVAAATFAAASICWLIFYFSKAKPLLDRADKYEYTYDHDKDSRSTYYSIVEEDSPTFIFSDENKSVISYNFSKPDFLDFFTDVQVMTSCIYDYDPETKESALLTDYTYFFRYSANLFGDKYSFRIDDYTNSQDTYIDGVLYSGGASANYYIEVDKDMNFISGDRDMFDEHYDQLKELFDKTKEVFGDAIP